MNLVDKSCRFSQTPSLNWSYFSLEGSMTGALSNFEILKSNLCMGLWVLNKAESIANIPSDVAAYDALRS